MKTEKRTFTVTRNGYDLQELRFFAASIITSAVFSDIYNSLRNPSNTIQPKLPCTSAWSRNMPGPWTKNLGQQPGADPRLAHESCYRFMTTILVRGLNSYDILRRGPSVAFYDLRPVPILHSLRYNLAKTRWPIYYTYRV